MRSPPLGELYDLLRADGFAIGVDDHIRIGRLLARDAAWTLETLRISIAALVVTDLHERVVFDACWDRWMRNLESLRALEVVRPVVPTSKPSTVRRLNVISGVIAIIVAVVLAVRFGTGALTQAGGSGTPQPMNADGSGTQPPINMGGSGTQPPINMGGSGSKPALQVSSSSSQPIPSSDTLPPAPDAAAKQAPPPFHPAIDLTLVALALGMILLVFAAIGGWLGARARRRFVPGPWRYTLAVPPATKPVLPRKAIEDAAVGLTWQVAEMGQDLDLARSVVATAERGGLPTFVHRRPVVPRYLVLEDTASGADRWKFVYDELFRGLACEGVEFERYTFAANPEECIGPDGRVVGLVDLLDHTDALIVIGDGDAAIDPLDGERAEWLALLRHKPQRLWINPFPPARWSAGAHAIAADTPMEHGVSLALVALNAGVDHRVRWHNPYPTVIERAPGTASALEALRTALGERAFRLVAAVAVTGPPTIAAARWLAETHALKVDEEDWLSITTLPWFGTEQWPEGLRDRLSEALGADSPELAQALAATADRLRAASEPPRDSAAHLMWQFDGAYRAGRQGELAVAARSLNQIAGTPLAYQARRLLATLGLRNRTRRAIVSAIVVGAALIVGAAAFFLVGKYWQRDCDLAIREIEDVVAARGVCEREYARTQDPGTGAKLASLLERTEKFHEASELANSLLATSARGDALQVLGKLANKEQRLDEGRMLLETARALHVAEHRPKETAVDDQALSSIFRTRKQFAEALRAIDSCITKSREVNDRVLEGYCHMSAATLLGEIGQLEGAQEELARAEPLFELAGDRAELALQRGLLHQRYGFAPLAYSHNAQAVVEFKGAITLAKEASLTSLMREAELKLVYSLAELGRTDDATHHLETARQLDSTNTDADERALLEARIAYRRGDFALATSINTRVYGRLADDDQRLHVCIMQAQIGLAGGDLEATMTWAARGIEITERMLAQSALELRPSVLWVRRQPHELLFTALARAHRFAEALAVFDQWQGRMLLDAMARSKSTQASSLRNVATHSEELRRLFPVLSNAPLMKPIDRDTLIDALRGVDLVAVLVANEEVWRITARHGRLDIVDLGAFATLRPLLDQFVTVPTRIEPGEALGAKILGDDTFRETAETLFVLLDGPLAGVPVAALRARGRTLVAMRPIVHVSRLSELGCVPALSGVRHAVILADARGDLPAARREATVAAANFGVRPVVGSAATRDALFAASGADILHIAVHASVGIEGGFLELYDQPVSALEIAAHGGGPQLVVLSASEAAADDGSGPSLATAFLASGSTQVIAPLHAVTDAGASEVISAFYRSGGVADPARSLAHIQAELANTANTDWPNFILFGHDICRKESP